MRRLHGGGMAVARQHADPVARAQAARGLDGAVGQRLHGGTPASLPQVFRAVRRLHGERPMTATVDGNFIAGGDKLLWVFGDFETFWSQDYSISNMDPPSYIL